MTTGPLPIGTPFRPLPQCGTNGHAEHETAGNTSTDVPSSGSHSSTQCEADADPKPK